MRSASRLIIVLSSVYCSGIDGIWDLGWAECRSTPADDLEVRPSLSDVLAGRCLSDVAGLYRVNDVAGLSRADEVCGR
jgi:hypothetical protein